MLQFIHVENFKVLRKADFILSNLTLLAGLNSMGKSTLIQSLLLIRQSYEQNPDISQGLMLNSARYINLGLGKDILSNDAENEIFKFYLKWDDNVYFNLEFGYKSASNVQPINPPFPSCNDDDIFDKALFSNRFQYLSAERLSPRSTFPVDPFEINTRNSLGQLGQYTVHFIAANQQKPLANKLLFHPKAKADTLLSNIDAWMSEITPGVRITAKVIEEVNQASLHFEFETKHGYTEKFRPENVGFGLTYVLPVVTAVLASEPGDLLLIENPEAHLHPQGQSVIGRLIAVAAQSGVQIITETHSDHFLNGIRVAVKNKIIDKENISIYYLQRNKNNPEYVIETKQPFIDENGRLDEWPEGFFDEWDKQIDELLK
jgi:predicted ATPase